MIKRIYIILKSLYWSIQNLIVRYSVFGNKGYDLIILDDAYPSKTSLFRYIEFNYYLNKIPNSIVYSTGDSYRLLNDKADFNYDLKNSKNRVKKYREKMKVKSRLAYCNFLHLSSLFLRFFETNEIPFVFTLYPGGALYLNNNNTIDILNRIFSSKQFRHVIVTQKITYDLVLNLTICPKEKIEFIYGVVTQPVTPFNPFESRKSEAKINCCFVSNQYTPNGVDKGYDVFLQIAEFYSSQNKINFHVIGNGYNFVHDNIIYHGPLELELLDNTLSKMDIVISFNRPNILFEGAFDGFPTGGTIQAALNGCLMLVNDPLDQNIYFENYKDIIICNDSNGFIEIIEDLKSDPVKLEQISENGRIKALEIFGEDFQLKSRLKIIKNYTNNKLHA